MSKMTKMELDLVVELNSFFDMVEAEDAETLLESSISS